MRIALNLHFLRPGITGGGETYAVELVRALAAIDSRNEYLVICNGAHERLTLPRQPNFKLMHSTVNAGNRPLRYAWEQIVLPARLHGRGLDLVHSLGYVSPLLARQRQVVTVPDANWKDLDTMSPTKRRLLGFFASRSIAAADVVITGTHAAATALTAHFPAAGGRIRVVHLGADHLPTTTVQDVPGGISRPYILAISGGQEHKNTPRLLAAFSRIAGRIPHCLVIAGNAPSPLQGLAAGSGLGERLRLTGYISDDTLAALMAAADLFVFPSWHEGFGLPLLEAQRCGSPVAASNIPALAEIAGGTAELFDPLSVDSIAAAILRVVANPDRRRMLAEAGHRNAAGYTWKAAARATLEIYERVSADRDRRTSR